MNEVVVVLVVVVIVEKDWKDSSVLCLVWVWYCGRGYSSLV